MVRTPLAAFTTAPLQELAESADRMVISMKGTKTVSNITGTSNDVDAIASRIVNHLDLNSKKRHNFHQRSYNNRNNYSRNYSKSNKNYSRSNSNSGKRQNYHQNNRYNSNYKNSKHSNTKSSSSNHSNAICFYHSKYGKNALHCNKPCEFEHLASKTTSNRSSRDSSPSVTSCVFSVPFNIDNSDNDIKFMIDSGSSYSIIPEDLVPKNVPKKIL